jgi:hypothetical protein
MALAVDRGPEAVEMAMKGETNRQRRMHWESRQERKRETCMRDLLDL